MNNSSASSSNNELDSDIEIHLDLHALAMHLSKNPEFVNAIAAHVRTAMLKDVRKMGNLFKTWGGLGVTNQTLPPPTTLNTNQRNRLS
jgi:hypothetical protein